MLLGIAYEGMAIPIYWTLLPKKGTSNTAERIRLIKKFTEQFGKACIAGLLADREFTGQDWFQWLTTESIPFYIRIKEDTWLCIKKQKFLKAEKLFSEVTSNTMQMFGMAVEVFGVKCYVSAARSERGELLVVASNQASKNAVAIYLRRWEIEALFQGLKGRGFRFEETHVTQPERIEKLIALLAIGFCWAHKVGEWKARLKPIVFKKHRDGQHRPQYSFIMALSLYVI